MAGQNQNRTKDKNHANILGNHPEEVINRSTINQLQTRRNQKRKKKKKGVPKDTGVKRKRTKREISKEKKKTNNASCLFYSNSIFFPSHLAFFSSQQDLALCSSKSLAQFSSFAPFVAHPLHPHRCYDSQAGRPELPACVVQFLRLGRFDSHLSDHSEIGLVAVGENVVSKQTTTWRRFKLVKDGDRRSHTRPPGLALPVPSSPYSKPDLDGTSLPA